MSYILFYDHPSLYIYPKPDGFPNPNKPTMAIFQVVVKTIDHRTHYNEKKVPTPKHLIS